MQSFLTVCEQAQIGQAGMRGEQQEVLLLYHYILSTTEAFNWANATAHDEDVSAWAGAIGQGIKHYYMSEIRSQETSLESTYLGNINTNQIPLLIKESHSIVLFKTVQNESNHQFRSHIHENLRSASNAYYEKVRHSRGRNTQDNPCILLRRVLL